jgi:hypothetical protein
MNDTTRGVSAAPARASGHVPAAQRAATGTCAARAQHAGPEAGRAAARRAPPRLRAVQEQRAR